MKGDADARRDAFTECRKRLLIAVFTPLATGRVLSPGRAAKAARLIFAARYRCRRFLDTARRRLWHFRHDDLPAISAKPFTDDGATIY